MKPIAVSVPEAARMIGVGRTSMFGLIRSKKIAAIRIGRRTLVPIAELEALLATNSG